MEGGRGGAWTSQVFWDNKGVWTKTSFKLYDVVGRLSNDRFRCRCNVVGEHPLHIAYEFGHRVLPMTQTLPDQVIKGRLTRADGDENPIALLFRRLLISASDYRSAA